MEVILVVFVEFYFEHVVEKLVLFARLRDFGAFLKVAGLIDSICLRGSDNSLSKCDNWLTSLSLVSITEVAEGTLGDLDVPAHEVGRQARLEFH